MARCSEDDVDQDGEEGRVDAHDGRYGSLKLGFISGHVVLITSAL